MADESIKVRFIGEGGQLNKTLGDLQGQLKRFQDALKTASNVESFNRLQRAIEATKGRIESLNSSAAKSGLSSVAKGSNEATQSLTNLSRVAQDAPYGFIGIANNINPLLESFQRLQVSTGSTGGAFKALASSMMGAGGLGLAVGVASSLLVTFGGKLFSSKKEADALTDAIRRVGDAADVARESLSNFQGFSGLAAEFNKILKQISGGTEVDDLAIDFKSVGGEIDHITKLLNKLEEDKGPLIQLSASSFDEDEVKAADEAIKKLSDEQTKLINDRARLSLRQGTIEQRMNLQRIKDAKDAEDKIKAEREKALAALQRVEFNFFDHFFKVTPKPEDKAKQVAEMWKIATEFALRNQDIYLGLDKILKADTKESAVDAAKKWWNNFQDGLHTKDGFASMKMEAIDIELPDPKKSPAFKKLPEIDVKLTAKPTIEYKETDLQKQISKFQADINNAFKGSFTGGFSGIGEALGAAIAEGANPIEAAGRSILSTIGDLISQIGKALIEYGVVKEGLDKIFAAGFALPGVAAIAAGVAAVAIGALIKNSFKNVKKFAQGGWVPGHGNQDTVPALLTPGEFVIPKAEAQRMKSPRGNSSVMGTGGAGNMRIVGELRAHMRDLVASFALENQSQRRAFG